MFQTIIVPVDGSKRSWKAARFAAVIARQCDAKLELVNVVFDARQHDHASQELRTTVEAEAPLVVEPILTALVATSASDDTVGSTIARFAESAAEPMIVMSSTGRGRTASVLGSVADEVVRAMSGPIVVVGPQVEDVEELDGDLIVPVDGSDFSETSLPLAASWAAEFGMTPWIVEVLTGFESSDPDVRESAYPSRLAQDLKKQSNLDVEFEVLHGSSAAAAIVDYATGDGTGMILMSTHGRGGIRRLTMGSVAASVVHTAPCPVVLHRPPSFGAE